LLEAKDQKTNGKAHQFGKSQDQIRPADDNVQHVHAFLFWYGRSAHVNIIDIILLCETTHYQKDSNG